MTASADLVAEDTGAQITLSLQTSEGQPLDLTGSTVQFVFDVDNGALLAKRTVSMVVDADPTTGIATYQFAASDLPEQTVRGMTTSILRGEARVTDSLSKETTSKEVVRLVVRNRL